MSIVERVAELAAFLIEHDLESVRIERPNESFEVGRNRAEGVVVAAEPVAHQSARPSSDGARVEQITSDRVGIFHFSRPLPFEGERIDEDRELGFIEQLGIRNPIRSRGPGRIHAILQRDGDIVDYGRPLFELERS
jgi:biotin carboxyl carrier protein